MSCVLKHQHLNVPLISQRFTSISRHDIIAPVPKELSSPNSLDGLLDLLLDQRFSAHKSHGRSKRKSKSSFSLKLLVQESATLTKSSIGRASMSKLGGCVPHSNPLTQNAVFDGHAKAFARPMPLKLRNNFEENPSSFWTIQEASIKRWKNIAGKRRLADTSIFSIPIRMTKTCECAMVLDANW